VIIALGESIVAIGVGAGTGVDAGVVTAAVLGVAVAGALWWLYFDVVALVAARRLPNAEDGRQRNEMARDPFSYLHHPMDARFVLAPCHRAQRRRCAAADGRGSAATASAGPEACWRSGRGHATAGRGRRGRGGLRAGRCAG